MTPSGQHFQYNEVMNDGMIVQPSLTGMGTGTLNPNSWNSLLFDIEVAIAGMASSGQDFLNLFQYIKTGISSVSTGSSTFNGFQCIIVISIAHSCSNYDDGETAQSVISTIISDTSKSYDYLQTQMYTQNITTINEYVANYNIPWTPSSCTTSPSFQTLIQSNALFQQMGNLFLLPSVSLINLFDTRGTNTQFPNLYFYQNSSNSETTLIEDPSGISTINYTMDQGVVSFFQTILNNSSNLGGFVKFVNGSVTDSSVQNTFF